MGLAMSAAMLLGFGFMLGGILADEFGPAIPRSTKSKLAVADSANVDRPFVLARTLGVNPDQGERGSPVIAKRVSVSTTICRYRRKQTRRDLGDFPV